MYLRSLAMHLIYTTPQGNDLWLGDYDAATDLGLLKLKKISTVLTAAADLQIKYPKQLQINHKILDAYDIPAYKMTPHFKESYQFIKKGLQNGNILVHCAAGISRSATCVIAYLMRQKGYGFRQCLQLVKNKRKYVNPNFGFQNELIKFQQFLKEQGMKQQQNHSQSRLYQKACYIAQPPQEKISNFNFMNRQFSQNQGTYGVGNSIKQYSKRQLQQKKIINQFQSQQNINPSRISKIAMLNFGLENLQIPARKK